MKFPRLPTPMSTAEARSWIDQVDGVVYHNEESEEVENTWVAVVRTPAGAGRVGKVILAFGESPEEATGAAEAQWDEIWEALSSVH